MKKKMTIKKHNIIVRRVTVPKELNNTQLKIGMKVEREHTKTINYIKQYLKSYKRLPSNKQIFTSITKDHLKEFPNTYYTELIKLEKKLKKK